MMHNHSLGSWDLAVFTIYLAASLGVGLYFSKSQKSLKMYLLANQQIHWSLVGISVLAALFSGASFLGAPAEAFGHNLVYLWAVIAFFIATPITACIFVPLFYSSNFYTAYEYLEQRFDLRMRLISSGLFIVRVVFWVAIVLYAPSLAIAEVLGWPLWVSVLVMGFSTTLYTTFGGMKAVIYTDVMQFGVLVCGIIAIAWMAVRQIPGGIAGAWSLGGDGHTQFIDLRFDPTVRMTVWGALLGGAALGLVQMVTDQISVQRYLTATSMRASQRALWFKLVLVVPFVSLFLLLGTILYAFYKTHPELLASLSQADRVLPNFVVQQMPSPFPGLMVAAIFAATMSAAASGISALTTATLKDFIQRLGNKEEKEGDARGEVRKAKAISMAYGLLCTGLGMTIGKLGTIVEASAKIIGICGGPLLGVFFLAALSKRVNGTGALIGCGLGTILVLLVIRGTQVSFVWYALIGAVSTYVLGEVSAIFSRPPSKKQQSLMHAFKREEVKIDANNE